MLHLGGGLAGQNVTLTKVVFKIHFKSKNKNRQVLGYPPHFSPNFFFPKMTQNGLKWILNTTLVNVTF